MRVSRRGPVITQRALAKVNLVLRIRGRRPDGYHEIDSLMHTIGLADDVSVTPHHTLALECSDPRVPTGEGNLAYRAAQVLAEACRGPVGGALIRIRKRIPVAAGLGGGSADAAAVLSLLNEAWGCGLPWDELVRLAARLGADVPFCLLGGAARATGIGERLQAVEPRPGIPIVLIAWPDGLSTADVYRAYDETRPPSTARVEPALEALRHGDLRALGAALANDLQPVVEWLRPETRAARGDLLSCGALGAAVTGSGPTVFGLFSNPQRARKAARDLASRWPMVIVTELAARGLGSMRTNTWARRDGR